MTLWMITKWIEQKLLICCVSYVTRLDLLEKYARSAIIECLKYVVIFVKLLARFL